MATEVPSDTANFTVTAFNTVGTTCTATETVPAGYQGCLRQHRHQQRRNFVLHDNEYAQHRGVQCC
jgi:hypothetical protein